MQPFGDLPQKLVADTMPPRIVDELEAVEIDKQKTRTIAGRGDGGLHSLPERDAVCKAGQRVVVGELMNAPFRFHFLGDERPCEHRSKIAAVIGHDSRHLHVQHFRAEIHAAVERQVGRIGENAALMLRVLVKDVDR